MTVRESEFNRLNLAYTTPETVTIRGYGEGRLTSLGTTNFSLKIDDIETRVNGLVVPDTAQNIPVLVGHPFTEQPNVIMVKDNTLKLLNSTQDNITAVIEVEPVTKKIVLWPQEDT